MDILKETIKLDNGETLTYRKKDGGENVLLLIHGNMSSSKHYEPLMNGLPEDFSAYAVDLRGFGESTYNQPIESLADFAEDLALFSRALGLKTFTPVGWSTGGGVAMEMAAKHQDQVKCLILLETVSYRGLPIYRKDENGQPKIGEHYKSKEEMATDPVQVAPAVKAFEEGNVDFIKYLWDELIFVVDKPPETEYKEYLEATMKQRNLVDVDWALVTFNLGHEHNGVVDGNGLVDKISCPVLAFWGDRDLVVTRDMVEETAEAIGDNAHLVVLENCGHNPIFDSKDKLFSDITGFIRKNA